MNLIGTIQIGKHGEKIKGINHQTPRGLEVWDGFEPNIKLSDETCIHAVCNGFFDFLDISTTHQVAICRRCYLRTVIPISVKTFTDLQKWSHETYTQKADLTSNPLLFRQFPKGV